MSKMRDLQDFPAIFTFKIVGEKSEEFEKGVETLFDKDKKEVKIDRKESSGGKFLSFSLTTVIETYEELEDAYKKISALKGIKFYV